MKKNIKRLLALAMVFAMAMSCMTVASAAEYPADSDDVLQYATCSEDSSDEMHYTIVTIKDGEVTSEVVDELPASLAPTSTEQMLVDLTLTNVTTGNRGTVVFPSTAGTLLLVFASVGSGVVTVNITPKYSSLSPYLGSTTNGETKSNVWYNVNPGTNFDWEYNVSGTVTYLVLTISAII